MEFVEYVNAILQAQQTKYVIKIMVSVFVTQTLLVQNVINVHRDFIITQIGMFSKRRINIELNLYLLEQITMLIHEIQFEF
jgi:hypothetical protein